MSEQLTLYQKSCGRFEEVVTALVDHMVELKRFTSDAVTAFEVVLSPLGVGEFVTSAYGRCKEILSRWIEVHYGHFLAYIYAKYGTVSSPVPSCYKDDIKFFDDSSQRLSDLAVPNQRTVACSQDGIANAFKKLSVSLSFCTYYFPTLYLG